MSEDRYLAECLAEARRGLAEGGIPIGAVLVSKEGEIIGRGRNRRVQDDSVIHHAEMNCLENAGRLPSSVYAGATLYTTLSPCFMCAGAAVLLGIRRVVAGENRTVAMGEEFLRGQGVDLQVLDDAQCFAMLQAYIRAHPEVWHEDKGDH
jgi:cytosine deaminase